jgi:single-strand DNA-binding protein
VWRQAAENAAETLTRGMRVIVQGRLKQRSYEDREQVKRTVYEIDVEEVGPSLLRASAKVTKNPAGGGQQQGGAQPAQQQPPQQAGGWGGGQAAASAQQTAGHPEEPPF